MKKFIKNIFVIGALFLLCTTNVMAYSNHNVGDSVEIIDGSTWHVITTSDENDEYVVLIKDQFLPTKTDYDMDRSKVLSNSYINILLHSYFEDPSTGLTSYPNFFTGGDSHVRLITESEFAVLNAAVGSGTSWLNSNFGNDDWWWAVTDSWLCAVVSPAGFIQRDDGSGGIFSNYIRPVIKIKKENIKYDINTTQPSVGGNIEIVGGIDKALTGQSVEVKLNPDTGYRLKPNTLKLNGSTLTLDSNNKFTMPTNTVTITAEFELIEYDITLNDNASGNILQLKDSDKTAKHGDNKDIDVSAKGYNILSAKINGNLTTVTDGKIHLSNIDKNINIDLDYELIEYNITLNDNSDGNIIQLKDSDKTAKHGDNRDINVSAKGYNILSAKVNGNLTTVTDGMIHLSNIDTDINIELDYEKVVEENPINPITYDNILIYVAVGIISLIGIIFIFKKLNFKSKH